MELDGHQQKMKDDPDREMCDHMDKLEGKDLKSGGWSCIPIENVDHDFVSPLLDGYVKDLGRRIADHDHHNSGLAKTMRKGIRISDAENMVNVQYQKIIYLKKQADEKEQQLELARRLNDHNKKTKKLITEKVEFKKAKAFGRQNSYTPQLEEFGDIDDADAFRKNMGKMRRSYDLGKKREPKNTVVKDIALHRLEKDIMAVSVTDSMY